MRGRRAAAWQHSPLQIMAWHLESEPVKCQTGYDRNGDRQIMTHLWPGSSERSQLTQPSVRWCAFRSRKKVNKPNKDTEGKFANINIFFSSKRSRIHGNSLLTYCCNTSQAFCSCTAHLSDNSSRFSRQNPVIFKTMGPLVLKRVKHMQASYFWLMNISFVICHWEILLVTRVMSWLKAQFKNENLVKGILNMS